MPLYLSYTFSSRPIHVLTQLYVLYWCVYWWIQLLVDCYDGGNGGLLCDEMGLGKTCQAICFILSVIDKKRPTSLVLCPLTVLDNWKQEFNRFSSLAYNIPIGHNLGYSFALVRCEVMLVDFEQCVMLLVGLVHSARSFIIYISN